MTHLLYWSVPVAWVFIFITLRADKRAAAAHKEWMRKAEACFRDDGLDELPPAPRWWKDWLW